MEGLSKQEQSKFEGHTAQGHRLTKRLRDNCSRMFLLPPQFTSTSIGPVYNRRLQLKELQASETI